MRYNSIALIYSLCIVLSFLIPQISAQRPRLFNISSPFDSLSIEKRLNAINKILHCILQQEENIYSPELIKFANENFNNINEDILKVNISKYIRKKEDQDLIYECQKFKYVRIRPIMREKHNHNNNDDNDIALERRSIFREFVKKEIDKRLAEQKKS